MKKMIPTILILCLTIRSFGADVPGGLPSYDEFMARPEAFAATMPDDRAYIKFPLISYVDGVRWVGEIYLLVERGITTIADITRRVCNAAGVQECRALRLAADKGASENTIIVGSEEGLEGAALAQKRTNDLVSFVQAARGHQVPWRPRTLMGKFDGSFSYADMSAADRQRIDDFAEETDLLAVGDMALVNDRGHNKAVGTVIEIIKPPVMRAGDFGSQVRYRVQLGENIEEVSGSSVLHADPQYALAPELRHRDWGRVVSGRDDYPVEQKRLPGFVYRD